MKRSVVTPQRPALLTSVGHLPCCTPNISYIISTRIRLRCSSGGEYTLRNRGRRSPEGVALLPPERKISLSERALNQTPRAMRAFGGIFRAHTLVSVELRLFAGVQFELFSSSYGFGSDS